MLNVKSLSPIYIILYSILLYGISYFFNKSVKMSLLLTCLYILIVATSTKPVIVSAIILILILLFYSGWTLHEGLENMQDPKDERQIDPKKKLAHPDESKTDKYNINNDQEPKIDFAKTMHDSYADLNDKLGSQGIHNLTADTHKLMEQQQKLTEAMTNIGPLIANAQHMLSAFIPKK